LTGWTLTRPETATASELANIRFRLCKVNRRPPALEGYDGGNGGIHGAAAAPITERY
jgi:hypothetical protein